MSRSARVDLFFGDRKHSFALTIGGAEELQEKCDAGPEEIFDRIATGRWRLADIQQTLRLGLIGGGMSALEAAVMVERYAGPGALAPWKPTCQSILLALLVGAPDEKIAGEPGAGKRTKPRSPAASGASASSTKSAGSSGSRPKKSRARPPGG